MNGIFTVARKEAGQILRSRQLLISAIIVTLVFSTTAVPAALSTGGAAALDRVGFMLLVVIGVFIGYIFSGQAFLREKTEGTIETLLCSPLSLREIWLGKVIGVTLPAYALTLGGAAVLVAGASALAGVPVLPSGPLALHLLVVVPAFIAVAVGMLGLVQLLLGMRENQIINMAVVFLIIFFFSASATGLMGPDFQVTWEVEGTLLAIALALLLALRGATRFLDRERIVTTIP
jgi:ABC-2 type transport system permease protein